MPGKVYLVRHGHTRLNSGSSTSVDRIRGWSDIPLSPEGVQDAEHAAAELADVPVDRVMASNLKRSMETARIIAKPHAVPVKGSMAWRPWHLGALTNQPSKAAQPVIAHFAEHAPSQAVPEGESFNTFRGRFLTALERLLKAVEKSGETVVLVSHFRTLKLTQAWLKAGGKGQETDLPTFFKNDISPAAILLLRPAGDHCEGTLVSRGIKE